MKLSEKLQGFLSDIESVAERPFDNEPCFNIVMNTAGEIHKLMQEARALEKQIEIIKKH